MNYFRMLTKMMFRLSCFGAKRGPHVTRYTMYKELAKFAVTQSEPKKVLSISGSQTLCKVLGFDDSQIHNVQYPDVSILSLPYPDSSYDALIADQVLEHVKGDPQKAIEESFRVVKPGGLVVQTTCQIMPRHMVPDDYWRFTPNGLHFLAEPYGEILEVSGWGHPSIVILDCFGLRHEPIPELRWHPANIIARSNRDSWPVVTWVVGKKRAG